MDYLGIFWTIAIGLVAGWLAGKLVTGGRYGLVGDLTVGILGAFLGIWIYKLLQVVFTIIGSLFFATLGAVILLLLLKRLQKGWTEGS